MLHRGGNSLDPASTRLARRAMGRRPQAGAFRGLAAAGGGVGGVGGVGEEVCVCEYQMCMCLVGRRGRCVGGCGSLVTGEGRGGGVAGGMCMRGRGI